MTKAPVLLLKQPKTLELVMAEMDADLQDDEALVEVCCVSLCGSDYKLYHGLYAGPNRYPLCFGHEWAGRVRAVGQGVVRLKVGDRVTGDCSIWCGSCERCAVDKNVCQSIEKYGITRDGFSRQFKVVPAKYLYRSSPQLGYKVLALAEPFAVAQHAISRVVSKKAFDEKVLIVGCGSIGIAIYLLLKHHLGCKEVEICDIDPARLSLFRKILKGEKAGVVIDKADQLPNVNSYQNIYASGKYALVFEAVGQYEALQYAVDVAQPQGTIVTLGMFSPGQLNFAKVVLKALSIVGSIGGTGAFEEVLGFFEKNQSLIEPLVTARFSYKDANEAFREGGWRGKNLKVQIHFDNDGGNK